MTILLIWTSSMNPSYSQRLTSPIVMYSTAATGLTILIAFWLSFRSRWDIFPLICALGLFILAFVLMVITIFPLIIPPDLSLHAAASSETTQSFMLVGFALLMPVTFFYNTFGFRVFGGKIHSPRSHLPG